jgi:hypothetical protein
MRYSAALQDVIIEVQQIVPRSYFAEGEAGLPCVGARGARAGLGWGVVTPPRTHVLSQVCQHKPRQLLVCGSSNTPASDHPTRVGLRVVRASGVASLVWLGHIGVCIVVAGAVSAVCACVAHV